MSTREQDEVLSKPLKSDPRFQPAPRGVFTEAQEHRQRHKHASDALLCIDMQYLGCAEGYGVFEQHRESGVTDEAIEYYLDRVNNTVLPNVSRLQNRFRELNIEVIHCRIQSLTQDGRDRSPEHRHLALHAPPGSKLAEFLPPVAPVEDEIVINKTASGAFISTNLEYVLRNLGVERLFLTGVLTNECISSSARSACDLGFKVYVLSDCTAGITADLHNASLLTMQDRYAKVVSTDEVLQYLSRNS